MANPSLDFDIPEDVCIGCPDQVFNFYPFVSQLPRVQLYDSRVPTNDERLSLVMNTALEGWTTASSCFGQTVRQEGMAGHVTSFVDALSSSFSGDDQGV